MSNFHPFVHYLNWVLVEGSNQQDRFQQIVEQSPYTLVVPELAMAERIIDDISEGSFVLQIFDSAITTKNTPEEIYAHLLKENKIDKNHYIDQLLQERFPDYIHQAIPDYQKIIGFLDFHFENYSGKKNDFIDFFSETIDNLQLDRVSLRYLNEWKDKKSDTFTNLPLVDQLTGKPIEKIKCKASPAMFGFLMLELVKKGWIEPPQYNGGPNFTGLSRLCYNYFELNTTPGNLEKEMNEGKNTLTDMKRAKFSIPELSDLKR